MKRGRAWAMAVVLAAAVSGAAVLEAQEFVPLDAEHWELSDEGAAFTDFGGRRAIHLKDGSARLLDAVFQNGIIEYDVAIPEERGFVRVIFRAREGGNQEHFYLRSHQSGNPDANQYTPLVNGLSGWQIYYGPQYSAPTVYRFGEWMTVRLVVQGGRADVYVDGDEPAFHVDPLLHAPASGAVGFSSALVDAYVSNVRVTPTDTATLVGEAVPLAELPEHLIRTFEVSEDVFDNERMAGLVRLADLPEAVGTWVPLEVEPNGVANLARAGPSTPGRRTRLARVAVTADAPVTKRLRYGFSDAAIVYVNGVALAGGDDTYQSRDYRFLGTVGLFDEVYVPLRAGRNEIVFAVREAFGGWAVTAAFDDLDGIRLELAER